MADPTPAPAADPTPAPAPAADPAVAPVDVLGAPPAGDPAAQPAATPPATPPADVSYEFKFPEGIVPDSKVVDGLTAWAKENKLAPEAAQGAADIVAKFGESVAEKFTTEMANLRNEWVTAAKTDKEFGGDNFDDNLAGANAALQRFGSLELVKVLKETGLGNHPEVIRVFHKINQTISQDSVAAAISASASAGKTQAQRMYGAGSN